VSGQPAATHICVPDLGDFKEVEVIDVLVKPGDTVELETPLITLETEKATMDVPATSAGTVKSVAVKKGDRVSKGSLIVTLAEADSGSRSADSQKKESSPAEAAVEPPPGKGEPVSAQASAPTANRQPSTASRSYDFDLLVLGAGPGGYTAAFRAADLGMKVGLIERWPTLGGVCLNVGCIPSKALLHAAKVIDEAAEMAQAGIEFGTPKVDAAKLREWKNKVVGRLTGGLATLAKQRKVEVIHGTGKFVSPHELEVDGKRVSFANCIIAAGSESVRLSGLPDDPRIIDSTGALELDVPKRLLVIGGGIIGLEMATVYAALGVKVTVVELTDGLIPGCDRDLVRPLEKRIAKRYEKILVKTKVAKIQAQADGLRVRFESADGLNPPTSSSRSPAGEGESDETVFDRVLLAVGRSPNGKRIDAEAAGVLVNERGFIPVDRQMRTNVPHIFAIGDIAGQPMLAHKATHEGKLAAEVAHGEKRAFDARVIPSVAYTDPEIAWVGLTETDAKAKNIEYEKALFPWAASGRSLSLGRDEGFTKLLFDKTTRRVVGGGIVGPNAGDLIAEVALAIEMGCDATDIGLTIHPHPTLSETIAFAAEAFDGTLTDLYLPRRSLPSKAKEG
jgi:dihydrolipoamide dehydrogenase